MDHIIKKFSEVMSASPDAILSPGRIGLKKPAGAGDIPAVVMSLDITGSGGAGLGSFVRPGSVVVKHTGSVTVNTHPDTFNDKLTVCRILPLPLKKNPSSPPGKPKTFTANDLQVKNITDPTQPVTYTMADTPETNTQFTVDGPDAVIRFGAPQTMGDTLEIVHYTMTWREDISARQAAGSMGLEVWANSPENTAQISQKLQNKIVSHRTGLRQKGFFIIAPQSLQPIENFSIKPQTGSPFSVWAQKLAYRFVFESIDGGELSSGGIIKQIDIEVDNNLDETFSVPKKNQ